jgi:hypothetical protein
MDEKNKKPQVLTADELEVVTGGARTFMEPGVSVERYFKFAPLAVESTSLHFNKFSPLT